MNIKNVLLTFLLAISFSQSAVADKQQYIMQFKVGKGAEVRAHLVRAGFQIQRHFPQRHALIIRVPAKAIEALRKIPHIEILEQDHRRYLLSTQQVPYGISLVQADQVSDSNAASSKVCIIDSGYQLAHEDLSDNSVTGSSDTGSGNWYEDENGHGTHVAGTIAAFNNDKGVVGILPNGLLQLHIVKVFDAQGWAYSSSLVAALDDCLAHGADVVSMSLGGSKKSRFERVAFSDAYARGVLSVAAAGNDGNSRHLYPASYNDVISVAAIDQDKNVANFSQQTNQVELSAPGVNVLSTVSMGEGRSASVTINMDVYSTKAMGGSVLGESVGELVDCGLAETPCAASGDICLIKRGNITFADKALACQAGGGVAAIIYNNTAGELLGTLGDVAVHIPVVGMTDLVGAEMLGRLGEAETVTLKVAASNYAFFNGTSMATPHVAGVAALVWSNHPECSNEGIRQALQASAEDLGEVGRDNATGYGLVKAEAAIDHINSLGCAVERKRRFKRKWPLIGGLAQHLYSTAATRPFSLLYPRMAAALK